jgi:hypothetical protein
MFNVMRWIRSQPSQIAVEQELKRSIHLAFRLARQTGRLVSLALQPGPRRLVPRLEKNLAFGVPDGVPLPQGTLDPRWAASPRQLTVSPWHTATEGMWFLQDEIGSLCMHLTAKGNVRFLRFQTASQSWVEA